MRMLKSKTNRFKCRSKRRKRRSKIGSMKRQLNAGQLEAVMKRTATRTTQLRSTDRS